MFYSVLVVALAVAVAMVSLLRVGINRRKTSFIKTELQTILDALEPVALIDTQYNIIRVNQLYASIVGKSYRQLLGKKCYEAHFDRKSPCPGCQLYKAVVEKKTQIMPATVWDVGEHKVWYDITFTPVLDNDKNIKYIVETKKDITALHNIKTALEDQTADLERKARELAEKNEQLSIAYEQIEVALAEKHYDLEMARSIQQSLLPNLPSNFGHLHFWENYEPIQHIGGDLYDLIPLGDHQIGVFIGDVSGHGLAAAFVAAMVKLSLYNHIDKFYDPQRFFKDINHDLKNHLRTGLYLTAFWGIIDLKTNKIRYVRGSHPPPVIISGNSSMQQLDAKGMLIGMLPDPAFEIKEVQLHPGDKLFLFTDGCFSMKKADQTDFLSYAAFTEILHSLGHLPLDSIYGALNLRLQNEFPSAKVDDDRTFVAIEVLKKPLHERYRYLLHFPKVKTVCRHRLGSYAELEVFLAKLTTQMQAVEYSPRNISAVCNSVREIVENAIEHGHKGDTSKKMSLAWSVSKELFCLSCIDKGIGYDLEGESVNRGKGLFLLNTYMDEVFVEENGRALTIIKNTNLTLV